LDVDERRAQLVALGLEHFGTRAYEDVSIDAIAAAAGISKGLLYHYFPTKRAYYAEVVRASADQLVTACVSVTTGTPLERLEAALDAFLGYARAHAQAYATLMRSGVGMGAEIKAIVDETRAVFVDHLTSGFADAPLWNVAFSPEEPLVRLALRGWVGFAEAAALDWTEAIAATRPAPSQRELRGLLARTLLGALEATSAAASKTTR